VSPAPRRELRLNCAARCAPSRYCSLPLRSTLTVLARVKKWPYRFTSEILSFLPNEPLAPEGYIPERLGNLCFHLLKLFVCYGTPFCSLDEMVEQDFAPVSFSTGGECFSS
jgi:hypothetical protein